MNSPKVLEDGCATQPPPQRRPLKQNQIINGKREGCRRTFAKKVLTNQYKNRPKSSFRIRIAKKRFPRTIAPENCTAYGQWPDAANPIPMQLRVKMNVKNFLDE